MSWLLAPSQEQLFKNEELLATAVVRKKIEFAIAKCGLEPGKTVLEIGPGWGAFTAYALHARGGPRAGSKSWRFTTTAGAIISPSDNGRGILRPTKATCSAHSATSCTESFAFISGEQLYAFLARKLDLLPIDPPQAEGQYHRTYILVTKDGLRRPI